MGVGSQAGDPSHPPPPPQDAELSPKLADSGGVTGSHHVAEVPEDANRPLSGRQGSHVTRGVRSERTPFPRIYFN